MCVIAVAASERVTPEMAAKMNQANPHGAGIAWRDTEGQEAVVAYKKGLSLEEVVELCGKVPMPYVVHFRVPSCGGPSKLLTHPFPIQKDVPLELEGTTTGLVMFHNGHWGKYKDAMLEASIRSNNALPIGKWSDSRAMAWMAAHFGIGMLEFIDEKVVVFGPHEIELFKTEGWDKIGKGIWVSNKYWETERVAGFHKAPESTDAGKDDAGADDDKEDHTSAESKLNLQVTRGNSSKRDGSRSTESGTQGKQPSASQRGNGGGSTSTSSAKKGSGSSPFAAYEAALRLWQAGDISKNGFKKIRASYEKACRKMRIKPSPKPQRTEYGASKAHQATVH
jgi:hypothetical protein